MKFLLTIMLVLCFSMTFAAQDIKILETGEFHGDEAEVKEGEIWFGLFQYDDGFRLMPAILSLRTVRDEVVDGPGQSTGLQITVPGMGKPVFLIKGEGFQQARTVTSVNIRNKDITNGYQEEFSDSEVQYTLKAVSAGDLKTDFIGDNTKLVYTDGKTVQTLYEVEDCSFCRWQVNWIGDLDNDGKPDLYLMLTDHYNVSNNKLFLSSRAESGKLVREVTEFTTTGC